MDWKYTKLSNKLAYIIDIEIGCSLAIVGGPAKSY